MGQYQALVEKHGTLSDFIAVVRGAIGEISVDEAEAAIAKYRQEVNEALVADKLAAGKRKKKPAEGQHPEEICHRCGGPNVSWFSGSVVWNPVMRKDGKDKFDGIVCPTCFAILAREAGINDVWRFEPMLLPPEIEEKFQASSVQLHNIRGVLHILLDDLEVPKFEDLVNRTNLRLDWLKEHYLQLLQKEKASEESVRRGDQEGPSQPGGGGTEARHPDP
jgi:hypothetical protein